MKLFSQILFAAAATIVPMAASADRIAADKALRGVDLTNHVWKSRTSRNAVTDIRRAQIESANSKMNKASGSEAVVKPRFANAQASLPEGGFQPGKVIGPTSSYGDIDGPNNEIWFYTLDLKYDYIEYEYFRDPILQEFTLKVYDAKGALVGTIHDKAHYDESETRVPYCDMLPVITKNFFNTDDKYEVTIGMAFNTSAEYDYAMHYRSLVYQLGGEKDAEGLDKVVVELPELVADVLDASTSATENYFMTIISEKGGEGKISSDDYNQPSFWEKYSGSKLVIDVYGKAVDEKGPRKLLSKELGIQCLPGDQESGGYVFSKMYGGKPYLIFSRYEDTLTEPFYSYEDEMIQRKTNNLLIEVYDMSGEPTVTQTTRVPFKKDFDSDVYFTYCGIGSIRWNSDVDFEHFNQPAGKAAFFVTNSNYRISTDGVSGYSFYVYNADGTKRHTVMEDVESAVAMSNLPGFEPQHMFITNDERGYMFHFMNLYSNTLEQSMSYQVEIDGADPDPIMSNVDRVAKGDTYMYAAEMRYPIQDESVCYMRVAWFDRNGEFDHWDEINIGENIYYAMIYIDNTWCNPHAFYADDNLEYMMLVKRGIDETGATSKTQEELIIAQPCDDDQPEGATILHLIPDETRGKLASIIPYNNGIQNQLAVAWTLTQSDDYNDASSGINSGTTYAIHFYDLPLGGTPQGGVDRVETDGNVTDGPVEYFNLQGVRVSNPGHGLYIRRQGGKAEKIKN